MSSYLLTVLTKKQEVDTIIRDTIDKVPVLRFGRASDPVCLQLDNVLSKSAREVSKFASVALVDIDSNEIQVYVKYFDITFIPSTVFFFNAHHMKMDFGTADHTKWVGAFHKKQDFVDVVERGHERQADSELPSATRANTKVSIVIQGCIKEKG
ncbi:thioredoxin-like protein 4B isoform X2 [Quercus lobata]|uniref:thioredoxin-like protein 4B isoform X2 n=1 Tax=Quercus lobata TaxID=97700 RepID=UPI001248A56D|nr:thioredoxin-like protein 4B isoform X2 [Quercus lobata]